MTKPPDSAARLTEEPENDQEDEATEAASELIDSWESDNEEVLFELHAVATEPPHFEVLAINGPDDPEDDDPTVCLAWSKEDLDDVIAILQEIRGRMT